MSYPLPESWFECTTLCLTRLRPEAAEEEVTPFRSSYLLARFIDCSSSRLFLEVENNCVKKERVVNTNGKTHLLLTRCLALLFCTVKILLSKSNETDELTYQIRKSLFQKLISQNASLPRPCPSGLGLIAF